MIELGLLLLSVTFLEIFWFIFGCKCFIRSTGLLSQSSLLNQRTDVTGRHAHAHSPNRILSVIKYCIVCKLFYALTMYCCYRKQVSTKYYICSSISVINACENTMLVLIHSWCIVRNDQPHCVRHDPACPRDNKVYGSWRLISNIKIECKTVSEDRKVKTHFSSRDWWNVLTLLSALRAHWLNRNHSHIRHAHNKVAPVSQAGKYLALPPFTEPCQYWCQCSRVHTHWYMYSCALIH